NLLKKEDLILEENQMSNNQNQLPESENQNQDVQTATAQMNDGQVETAEVQQEEHSAHDDFDWSVDKRNVAAYSKEKKEQMEKEYDTTFKNVSDSDLLTGTVVGLTKTDVIVN